MLYQGIIGGESSPVEPVDLSPVLLWTNPGPQNTFAAQTVRLNLTTYAGVIVEFNHANNLAVISSRVYVKKTDIIETGFGAGFVSDRACSRNLTVNDSGVTFSDTYYATATKNDVFIPVKIYGVKEYVVEPVVGDLLWTNQNPTTALSRTEINADYSKYKYIRVIAKITSTDTFTSEYYIAKSTSSYAAGISFTALGIADYYRNIIFTDSKITIDSGHKATGGAVTLVDTAAIPLEIYGIE